MALSPSSDCRWADHHCVTAKTYINGLLCQRDNNSVGLGKSVREEDIDEEEKGGGKKAAPKKHFDVPPVA